MIINLKVEEHIYKVFFIFKIFLYLFRDPLSKLSTDTISFLKYKQIMHDKS
jgi:hypothetical protein